MVAFMEICGAYEFEPDSFIRLTGIAPHAVPSNTRAYAF
jgi:hypothetical protein